MEAHYDKPQPHHTHLKELSALPARVQAHVRQVYGSICIARRLYLDVDLSEVAAPAHDICRVTLGRDLLAC